MCKLSLNKLFVIFAVVILSAACSNPGETNTPPQTLATPVSGVPSDPTQSPAPEQVQAAAIVNGEVIPMSMYLASLDRYNSAIVEVGTILATDNVSQRILEDLIFRQILSQFAREGGFTADTEMVMQRLEELTQSIGDQPALESWMAANFYTAETLQVDLSLEMEAAWMREQIVTTTPVTAEQILARQVLFYTSFEAERIYAQLQNGAAFDIIVANNDPEELGYLGWFPRGYLFEIELENAAFQMQPGQYSQVIETRLGFHIIEILDYDADRLLSQDALMKNQSNTLRSWLEEKWSQSQIELLVK
ncbi:MAG: peptidylprolyl isomerase [Chloroflexota bacterium]